jgi:hypothetical protein
MARTKKLEHRVVEKKCTVENEKNHDLSRILVLRESAINAGAHPALIRQHLQQHGVRVPLS